MPAGAPFHDSAGETFWPVQPKPLKICAGANAPFLTSVLVSVNPGVVGAGACAIVIAGASTAIADALRVRGIPCEVAASAQKFGKQIRYAERRGIPYVWFPSADGNHEVKDIRSGDQVAADPASWAPPEVDLRPQVISTSSTNEAQETNQ